ncbi:hypothetical protein [Streptomyces bluensis]|uniref:hypothetical protein n=1 Tax=Streptomyces bluensis TaxID=33897 RepID=UPI0016750AE0|nr:hypothetical protein [Streptomyces bluensis]GGZ66347.1 hypothetical protein GCM10010344_36120 [Streptomyces bluensis]
MREWAGDGAELALKENATFSAAGLMLEYFECSSGGIQKKSGGGTWTTIEDGDTTTVLIDFQDGCSATLWAGESEGKTVLWATQADEAEVLILK